jgi:hypothetical protein
MVSVSASSCSSMTFLVASWNHSQRSPCTLRSDDCTLKLPESALSNQIEPHTSMTLWAKTCVSRNLIITSEKSSDCVSGELHGYSTFNVPSLSKKSLLLYRSQLMNLLESRTCDRPLGASGRNSGSVNHIGLKCVGMS